MIHLFYHRADLDGIGSALVILNSLLRDFRIDQIRLHGWNYGEEVKEVWKENDEVIIVDICFDVPTMVLLRNQWAAGGVLVTWIDHHKTSLAESITHGFSDLPGIRVEGTPSAILLAFEHYNGGLSSRQGVELLSDYDSWQEWKTNWESEIIPFQFGMRHYNYLKGIYNLMNMPLTTDEEIAVAQKEAEMLAGGFMNNCGPYVGQVKDVGRILVQYQDTTNQIAARRAFSFRWKGLTFACLNHGGVNSQVFDSVPFLFDGAMLFSYDGRINKWKFSLYGINKGLEGTRTKPGKSPVDFSVFAKEMGGGGHAGACGFEVYSLEEVFGVEQIQGPGMTARAVEQGCADDL